MADGVDTGVAVGAGVEATVVAWVGVALGATVDPHAARPRAAIAVPMMVVRFMVAHSTGTVMNGYIRAKCVERSSMDEAQAK